MNMFKRLEKKFSAWLFSWQKPIKTYKFSENFGGKKKVDVKDLKKKSKKDLEKIGRKVGIELDRRLTKDKLIRAIKKASK